MSRKPATKMAPEAAATAPRAQYQAPEKLTQLHNPEPIKMASTFVGRPSLRSAIDAMCKSCIYDPGNGNGAWREQVQGCSSSNCPLHPVRPSSVKAKKSGNEALEAVPGSCGPPSMEMTLQPERSGRNGHLVVERRAA